MTRKILPKPKGGHNPKNYVCLLDSGKGWESEWIEYSKEGWTTHAVDGGEHWPDMWQFLDKIMKTDVSLHLVGWRMYPMLCAARLYDQLQDGPWSISTARSRGSHEQTDPARKRLAGALVCETPPTIIDLRHTTGKNLCCLDLLNWGIEEEHVFFCPTKLKLQDVVDTLQGYIQLIDRLEMGPLQKTAAGQGFRRFVQHDMVEHLVAHTTPAIRAMEREAYYAGRSEAFRVGQLPGKVWHLDIKAMYSWLAETLPLPTRMESFGDGPVVYPSEMVKQHCSVIADVTVETAEPVLPLRCNGILMYPTRFFRTCLADAEYRVAMEMGVIRDTHRWAIYADAPIYRNFSRWYFRSLKQLGELGLAHLTPALKLAVNASYGRIGSRGKEWVDIEYPHNRQLWAQWYSDHPTKDCITPWRNVDGVTQYLDGDLEKETSLPQISACLCSAARVVLWRLMLVAGRKNVHYVDTDSLMVSEIGYLNLKAMGWIQPNEPGKLQIREVSDDVEIFNVKHYRFGRRICAAGVPQWAVQVDDGKYRWAEHVSFSHGLHNHDPFMHQFTLKSITDKMVYRHGKVLADKTVIPWEMEAFEERNDNGDGTTTSTVQYRVVGGQGPAGRQPYPDDPVPSGRDRQPG